MVILLVVGAVLLLMALWQVFVHPIATLRVLTRIVCGLGGMILVVVGIIVAVAGDLLPGVLSFAVGALLLFCANRLGPRV